MQDIHVDRHERGEGEPLGADNQRRPSVSEDEERLLETGIEAAQERDVREVLTIAVDDN